MERRVPNGATMANIRAHMFTGVVDWSPYISATCLAIGTNVFWIVTVVMFVKPIRSNTSHLKPVVLYLLSGYWALGS